MVVTKSFGQKEVYIYFENTSMFAGLFGEEKVGSYISVASIFYACAFSFMAQES
jgi:hypothetical protein